MIEDIKKDAELRMKKSVEALKGELTKLRRVGTSIRSIHSGENG